MVFPPQKPERRAVERDEQAIRRWIERDWPRIKRKARRLAAHIVFIDETGFLFAPLVRRTWALRGHTPVLHQRMRHHRKLSAIGGISISARRRRLGRYLHLHPDCSIDQDGVIAFLRDLLRHLRGHVIVIWDRLRTHRSAAVRQFVHERGRLHIELLPPYAPELNPNEYSWAHTKCNALANDTPMDIDALGKHVSAAVRPTQRDQPLLRGFVYATGLPIRL